MAAGQARHEHGAARIAFDDAGDDPRRASLDHVQDVGAYPTPWPVGTGACDRDELPRARTGSAGRRSATPRCSPTPSAGSPTGARGRSRSLAREVVLDIAARRIGIDPAELRRRNLLRAADMPFANPNGMPYDHMAPLRDAGAGAGASSTTTRSASRAGGRPRGRALPRRRHLLLRRADVGRVRLLRDRGRDDPHRAERQGQRLRGRRVDRQQPGDDRDPARRRRARSRHRRRGDDPGRHRGDAVRRRDRRQPQRADDGRGGRGDRRDPAGQAHRARRAQAGGGRARHRAREQPRGGARRPRRARGQLRGAGRHRLLPAVRAAAGDVGRPGGERPLRAEHPDAVGHAPPTCAPARST